MRLCRRSTSRGGNERPPRGSSRHGPSAESRTSKSSRRISDPNFTASRASRYAPARLHISQRSRTTTYGKSTSRCTSCQVQGTHSGRAQRRWRSPIGASALGAPLDDFPFEALQTRSSKPRSCSRSIRSPDFTSTAIQFRCADGSSTISTFRIETPFRQENENHRERRQTPRRNSPSSREPSREKATAPAFPSLAASASARRIAAAECGHSTVPGARPSSTRTNGNAT